MTKNVFQGWLIVDSSIKIIIKRIQRYNFNTFSLEEILNYQNSTLKRPFRMINTRHT